MKGTFKAILAATSLATLAGCSSFGTVEITERENYAQPRWYADCAQTGTEGYFWFAEDFAYACGAGESRYQQAAEEQMYAVAMNNFAKRINGRVNSETVIEINNDVRDTNTRISYTVSDTAITQHLEEERGTYRFQNKHYTFVKLKMPIEVFNRLLEDNRS